MLLDKRPQGSALFVFELKLPVHTPEQTSVDCGAYNPALCGHQKVQNINLKGKMWIGFNPPRPIVGSSSVMGSRVLPQV